MNPLYIFLGVYALAIIAWITISIYDKKNSLTDWVEEYHKDYPY
tara:strand:+ start:454 stop:585 length:132 start_codon:yes stop_codon:yes gene_type:complete